MRLICATEKYISRCLQKPTLSFCTHIRQILVTHVIFLHILHNVCKNPRYLFTYTSQCLQKPTLSFYIYFTLFAKTHVIFLHILHAVCKNPRYLFACTSSCLQKPTLSFYIYFTLFAKTHVIFLHILHAVCKNPRYLFAYTSHCLQKPFDSSGEHKPSVTASRNSFSNFFCSRESGTNGRAFTSKDSISSCDGRHSLGER